MSLAHSRAKLSSLPAGPDQRQARLDQKRLGPDLISNFCHFARLFVVDSTETSLTLDFYSKYFPNAWQILKNAKPTKHPQITLKQTDKVQVKEIRRVLFSTNHTNHWPWTWREEKKHNTFTHRFFLLSFSNFTYFDYEFCLS